MDFMIFLAFFAIVADAATVPPPPNYTDNQAKVLILGGGASGLQAAKVLQENGMDDFLVIEGADYLGGRMRPVQFGGVTIEQGANWAQPRDAPVVNMVLNKGMACHMSNWDSMVILNSTGHDLTLASDPIWEVIATTHDDMYLRAEKIVNENLPDMSQRAAMRLAGWFPMTPLEKNIEWFEFDFEWTNRPDITSLQSTALLPATTDIYFITDPRGFIYILDDIIQLLLYDPTYKYHARFKQVVTSIDQSSPTEVLVTTSDGTKYTGEYVLVTFSLGVLQNNLVQFIPTLPEWKVQAFSQFNMGSFTKIFIKFPFKFWGDEEWILHVNERRGYFPTFLNAEAAGLFPSGTNILVGFVVDEEARRIEHQPNSETKSEAEQVLRNLFGEQNVPDAIDIFISGWEVNPLTMGAYTNWPVEMSVSAFKQIQSKVDRIFFGGEATDEVYNGYVQGALGSGEREALKILNCISGSPECTAQYNPATDYERPCDSIKRQIWKPRKNKD
ncbi:uncharacterized protein [Amphiura filiformis]|uniref:uncharacterized protein n=1 Tax=Amphiura filiformis TaxID=82378 RepID=UPI003B20EA49